MIFVGDISVPRSCLTSLARTLCFDEPIVADLEGGLVRNSDAFLSKHVVFNDIGVLDVLRQSNVKLVTLANNHVLDIESDPWSTIGLLAKSGIEPCGAGSTATEAAADATLYEGGQEVRFLSFGWSVIGCRPARWEQPGINPLEPTYVLKAVNRLRVRHPQAKLVLLMHWNYELEVFPQPLHRKLAMAAIDAGANLIVGCHAHCVGGIEFYKRVAIVYCLGNWYVPQGRFFNGGLCYPARANRQLAVGWNPATGNLLCHWFRYDTSTDVVMPEGIEPVDESDYTRDLTPYAGFSHAEYTNWFRVHRKKAQALPVFTHEDGRAGNILKAAWVRARQIPIDAAVRTGLKRSSR